MKYCSEHKTKPETPSPSSDYDSLHLSFFICEMVIISLCFAK